MRIAAIVVELLYHILFVNFLIFEHKLPKLEHFDLHRVTDVLASRPQLHNCMVSRHVVKSMQYMLIPFYFAPQLYMRLLSVLRCMEFLLGLQQVYDWLCELYCILFILLTLLLLL